jgi:hypothetical protein
MQELTCSVLVIELLSGEIACVFSLQIAKRPAGSSSLPLPRRFLSAPPTSSTIPLLEL